MSENALITTEQLAAILGDPNLRLYDCTTYNEPVPPGSDVPYRAVPGDKTFAAGHIPGADFLDLQGEFSDISAGPLFMMADVPQLEAAFGRHGLDASKTIVLYSIGTMMWSTRFWWMLRSLGVDARVLDGGLDKWKQEGRPIETGAPKGYPATTFKASPRAGFFVDKDVVKARIGDPSTVIVNALGPQFHQGLEPSRYGRPGRVPGSVNVPAATLANADKTLTSLADAEAKFAAQGVTRDKNVIVYCGGGISATIDLLMLTQLGYDKLTLYDASMGEWARDPTLPIETD
ncbi:MULTISPECIES: sulfurtransferase [Bradyrhizobium]|uniref:Sulfurtransferase n=1 Tax=Bradyrhizobium arachidis TaxID=858423 RepID=A0AAE7TFH3_9BRAD|nr:MULTISPECIES: sulfurtransferase [Bradyrhizobium]QOG21301.1 sulfurtransferase [Bradyrhizobium sp. SEMIA]QOZ67132.1 sulfurtransferase [Bradyrhizobium arachidis]UFW51851.1 sulfurtransferase [Bradyrhizobium arachidis]SFV15941.1 thiosulfate/3-mercaptopyruvate sulfurtransferase [Bradyrhizobium arachidis]